MVRGVGVNGGGWCSVEVVWEVEGVVEGGQRVMVVSLRIVRLTLTGRAARAVPGGGPGSDDVVVTVTSL